MLEKDEQINELRTVLALILDCCDYDAPRSACNATDMVGAVLPYEILKRARMALTTIEEPTKAVEPFGPDWVRQRVDENQRGFGRKS